MNAQYIIRSAQTSDLDRLVELLRALQDHLEASNPDIWKMTAEGRANLKGQLVARIQASDSCALVAEHREDGVIGVILGRIVTNRRYTPSLAGSVDQAFVREDHRRAGVGSQLVAELCRFFAAAGVEDLTLRYVVGNEEAAGFWSNLGFTPRIVTTGARRQTVEASLGQVLGP